ncbi:cytochrome P450 [Apodospora peruviana]|uniref:Cytochrome P450 n=1 Tax=Apodospora peruviana TaxID=516989 RepID=A0AAE0HYY6_9PEZI|nr:cytochrome P450 [Apodospora peruviana]
MLPRVIPAGRSAVAGVWLSGGTAVSIQAYAMNRDPRYWYRADEFLPERWLPTESEDWPFRNDSHSGFQPFSLGPRACIGRHLAWAELRLNFE